MAEPRVLEIRSGWLALGEGWAVGSERASMTACNRFERCCTTRASETCRPSWRCPSFDGKGRRANLRSCASLGDYAIR
jgi:hypothetical protein